jgi:Pre-toxin TG
MSDDSEKDRWLPILSVASAVLNFVPVIGTAKGIVEAVTGEDFLTGEELSPVERGLGLLPLGGGLAKGASTATDVASMITRHSDAINAAERADELEDIAKQADKFYEVTRVAEAINNGQQLGKAMAKQTAADRKHSAEDRCLEARDAKSHESGDAPPARTPINSGGGDGPMEPGPVPPGIARDMGPDTPGVMLFENDTRQGKNPDTGDESTGSRPEVVGVPLGPDVQVPPPPSPDSGTTGPGTGEEICVPGDGLDAPATPGPTCEGASDTSPSAGGDPAPASDEVPADPGTGSYMPAADELPLQQGQDATAVVELAPGYSQPVNANEESSANSAVGDFFKGAAPTKRRKE